MTLTAAVVVKRATAYLSNSFRMDVRYCQALCEDMDIHPTFLAQVVQRLATDVGFTDASGMDVGSVWINSNEGGVNYIWCLPCPEEIIENLVSWDNPRGRVTNSRLKLVALVQQKATFSFIGQHSACGAPSTGSDNTSTAVWTFKETSTMNPTVADLLRIHSLVSRQFKIAPPVFYHTGPQNTMVNDALRRFDLSADPFLSFFTSTYLPLQYPST